MKLLIIKDIKVIKFFEYIFKHNCSDIKQYFCVHVSVSLTRLSILAKESLLDGKAGICLTHPINIDEKVNK